MAVTPKLDKGRYVPGETMTLTVTTAAGERDTTIEVPFTVAVSVPGVGEGAATAVLVKPGPLAPVVVTDADRTWVAGDDTGKVAVFTAKA